MPGVKFFLSLAVSPQKLLPDHVFSLYLILPCKKVSVPGTDGETGLQILLLSVNSLSVWLVRRPLILGTFL